MNKKLIYFIIIIMIMNFSSVAIAQNQEKILASKAIEFDNEKHLIEWFSSTECEKCRQFENQNSNANQVWINWFNSESDPINNLARDDTNRRLNQLNDSEFPLLIIDGNAIKINAEDDLETWSENLNEEINKSNINNFINVSILVEIIDSTGDGLADGIKLVGNITPLRDLHNETAIHIHIIENKDDPDDSGARPYISNVLKEWIPKMDFSVENGNSTNWDYTLSKTYLESADIDLNQGDSNRYSIILSVHGDEKGNSSNMRVLAVDSVTLPSINEHRGWSDLPLILLANFIIFVGLAFVVIQERIREKGLPLIQGKILFTDKGNRKVDLDIKTGNKKVEILSIETNKGWRTSKIGTLPTIPPKSNKNLVFKIHSKEQNSNLPIQITVKTEVEDLGQWMMDIDMISEKSE